MVQGLGNNMMNFNSISDYNKIFEDNMKGFNQEFGQNSLGEFENILNQQTQNLQSQSVAPPIQAGIGMDVAKLDFQMNNMADAQNVQKSVSTANPSGELSHNLSKGFSNGLNKLNEQQLEAQRAVETLAAGGDISVHEVMIASEKANLSMQMGLQLRNKILTAYNELYNIKI